jgi:hypothetical protein
VKGEGYAPPHVFSGFREQRLHQKSSATSEPRNRNDLHHLNPVSKLARMAGLRGATVLTQRKVIFHHFPFRNLKDGLCRA